MKAPSFILSAIIPGALALIFTAGLQLPEKAELLVDDPLDESTFSEHWKTAMGRFAIEDGIFTGHERLEQNHHAGIGRIEPVVDAIMQVEFKFVESDQIQFGFDYFTDEKKDHLLRAVIKDGSISARAGSGWGKTTYMKPFGPKPAPVDVPAGEWHLGQIEVYGQDVIISINGEVVFTGTAETEKQALDEVVKNRLALTNRGTAQFRNLKLWSLENVSAEDWQKRFKAAAN